MSLYADLLFTGGRVYTADSRQPWVEAVAVRDGRILAAGRASELAELAARRRRSSTCEAGCCCPASPRATFTLLSWRSAAAQVDVTGTGSAAEVAEKVRLRVASMTKGPTDAARADAWIVGGGWSASGWTDAFQPHRLLLDAVAPEIPVALFGKELHSIWLNSAALRRAGINANTPEIPGGVIDRDSPSGDPSGILRDNAMGLVLRSLPTPALPDTMAAVRTAFPEMWTNGIVAIHNANDSVDALALRTYQALHRRGELGIRVLQHIPLSNLEHARAMGVQSGLGDAWLRIGGVKMFADGALGSRTAHMLQPYGTDPTNWGVATMDPEEMLEQALAASAGGLSLTIHAIGDRANHDVLNVLAEVRRQETGDQRPWVLRHRIEHVQCIQQDDLPRLAQLDVIGSVQPIHATSDMRMVDQHWGSERARGAYAFRSLLDSGAHLIFGSDGPIEPHAPLIGIHAAVTRRRADGSPGPDGWQSQERLTVGEAIDAYTRWPAYAAAEESYRGSITPGKVRIWSCCLETSLRLRRWQSLRHKWTPRS